MNNSNETIMSIQKSARRHALVIGGSLAGLFAARVLTDSFTALILANKRRKLPQARRLTQSTLPSPLRFTSKGITANPMSAPTP